LVIAGAFDVAQALSMVEQAFGPIARPARVLEPTYTREAPRDGARELTVSRVADSYWLAALEIFVLWKADRITVESEWGRRILKRRNPYAKISVIEYGVSNIFFKTKWKPEKQKPIFLFVGTPIRRKGIQDLISAYQDKSLGKSELWVVGDGDSKWVKKQKKMSSINTKWLGFRNQREVAQLMSKAWALILPTRADNSPNVIKEARVVGMPVITTNKGGQGKYLMTKKMGI
jgi:glycosyltransferase involved in cell wall biosynthesis